MISTYQLKTQFQNLLRPSVNWLAKTKITPNEVTVVTCVASVGYGALLYFSHSKTLFLALPIFLFLRMAMNAIDGLLAKEHGMITKKGAMLNEFTDVVADLLLYLGFLAHTSINSTLLITLLISCVVSEFVGVAAVSIGSRRRYDGPLGKSDRALLFAIMALMLGMGIASSDIYNWVLVLAILLSFMTIYNRFQQALKS